MAFINFCPTCQCPLKDESHRCFFGQVYSQKERKEDDLTQHWEETGLLLDWAQTLSHAIFCVCKYDEEAGGEALKNIGGLTDLLTEVVVEEADRRLMRLYTRGKGWQERAEALMKGTPAAEQAMPAPAKKPGNGQAS